MRSLCERRRQHPLVANAHSRVARAAGASSAWLAGWAGGSIAASAALRRDLPLLARAPVLNFLGSREAGAVGTQRQGTR